MNIQGHERKLYVVEAKGLKAGLQTAHDVLIEFFDEVVTATRKPRMSPLERYADLTKIKTTNETHLRNINHKIKN